MIFLYLLEIDLLLNYLQFYKKYTLSSQNTTFAALEPAKPLHDAQMCGSFFVSHFPCIKTDNYLSISKFVRISAECCANLQFSVS